MIATLKQMIGRRVQAARAHAHLTQEQLAEKIGRSPEAVSNIERGISLPTLETLDRIAEALDVSLAIFFDSRREARSARRTEVEAKICLLLRELSDRDADIALGLVEVISQGRRRR